MTENIDFENIEKIRKDTITEIKEKARKNPNFLSPANKERLEYQEKLKFSNGYDFTCWMQQNGIMKSPAGIDRKRHKRKIENAGCKTTTEYFEKRARDAGFKDWAERQREWSYNTGRNLPAKDNPDCSLWFGYIGENYVSKTFEDPIRMPPGNPGFDWLCKRGEKIDHKGSCLIYVKGKSSKFEFYINHNNITDYFILPAWDNRDSLTPLHVLVFHKDDIVRGRKFCKFDTFTITNTPEKWKELEEYEVTDRLNKLRELCNKSKDEK